MSVLIPGVLVTGTFFTVAFLIFTDVLDTGRDQAISLLEATDLRGDQLVTLISIASVEGDSPITVRVDNIGDTAIVKAAQMDVFMRYIPETGNDPLVKRLTHVAGSPNDNQWSIVSISPDTFNPGLWDPGEQAELELNPVPNANEGSTHTVVVATPEGVSDSTSFVAP